VEAAIPVGTARIVNVGEAPLSSASAVSRAPTGQRAQRAPSGSHARRLRLAYGSAPSPGLPISVDQFSAGRRGPVFNRP
jgi:hypothetical protein